MCTNECTSEKSEVSVVLCQSCALPMEREEDFSKNADGSKNEEYCCYCFAEGNFTEPDITMEEMIEKVSDIMEEMEMPEDIIEKISIFIPMLKRWSK